VRNLRQGNFYPDDVTLEVEAIGLLAQCRYAPGTFAKKFVADVRGRVDRNTGKLKLSHKQCELIWKLVWQYRRQLRLMGTRAAGLVDYASKIVGKDEWADIGDLIAECSKEA
jgi:hypothetical protein